MPIIDNYEDLKKILQKSKTVAVIGISPKPERPSYFVSEEVKRHGFKMYLVNPVHEGDEILGEKVYGSIKEIPGEVDIVDVFRRPKHVVSAAKEAKAKGFKTFWLQPGTENWDVIEELDKEGYNVVVGACMKTCCQIML